jgi:hypothetical protein
MPTFGTEGDILFADDAVQEGRAMKDPQEMAGKIFDQRN